MKVSSVLGKVFVLLVFTVSVVFSTATNSFASANVSSIDLDKSRII